MQRSWSIACRGSQPPSKACQDVAVGSYYEVYVRINGEMRYLWRAVDHGGEVSKAT